MRLSKLKEAVLIGVMASALIISGCSTTWVTTFDNILVAAAPALINILNIIAIAKGVPVDATLTGKITTDAATVKTLAAEFAAASAAAAPNACSQLQAAITTYAADQTQVMSLANGLPATTATEVATLSELVAGTVTTILAVIPSCQAPASFKLALQTAPPESLRNFTSAYNKVLSIKTGNAAVDAYGKSHKIHVHSKLTRVLTLGRAS